MPTATPQFIYIVLILPAVFGLVLIGDGINQIINQEGEGVIAIIFGAIFIIGVIATYFIFTNIH